MERQRCGPLLPGAAVNNTEEPRVTQDTLALALLGATLVGTAPAASAGPAACDKRVNDTIAKLMECVTVDGVRQHQAAFQSFADAGDGTREASSDGYLASVDYVAGLLGNAGYDVELQPFLYAFFEELAQGELEQVAPNPVTYADPDDFDVMTYSGSGDVTAVVQAVDLVIPFDPNPNTSTSGCEASDFAGFTAGNIALLQRGSCSFALKALNVGSGRRRRCDHLQ
jgi:hypothetical protein